MLAVGGRGGGLRFNVLSVSCWAGCSLPPTPHNISAWSKLPGCHTQIAGPEKHKRQKLCLDHVTERLGSSVEREGQAPCCGWDSAEEPFIDKPSFADARL
jgi:hypothetical protein